MRPSTEETMGPGGHRGHVLVCASVRVCEGFVHVREVWTTTCRWCSLGSTCVQAQATSATPYQNWASRGRSPPAGRIRIVPCLFLREFCAFVSVSPAPSAACTRVQVLYVCLRVRPLGIRAQPRYRLGLGMELWQSCLF